MSPATLHELWTLVLPLVAFIISYVIQQAHWKPQTNGLIALITIIVATGVSLWLQGGNIDDATIVAALATAAQSEALAPLMPYVRGFPPTPTPPATTQPMQAAPSQPATPATAMSPLPPSPRQNTSQSPE